MIVRNEYPAGVPCWIDLPTADVQDSIEFYGGLFDWEFLDRAPSGVPRYVTAQIDGLDVAALAERPDAAPTGSGWITYVSVADAEASAARVQSAGGRVIDPPAEIPHAGIGALCADPDGARFGLWQAKGRIGAQRVNAHGSWNFNELKTIDPSAAERFYGHVFGWQLQRIDFGAGEMMMWKMPGYGDFLVRLDPEIRERHAKEAFDGFSDAVGWMAVAEPGTAAVWDLTFAVDDTDLAVERVAKLGGSVVEGPFDAGPTRVAVVTDPHGARFTVSKYTPA